MRESGGNGRDAPDVIVYVASGSEGVSFVTTTRDATSGRTPAKMEGSVEQEHSRMESLRGVGQAAPAQWIAPRS